MDGYLTKPIEREALHEALLTWLPKDGRLHPNAGNANHTQECEEMLTELVDESILDNLAEQIGCDNLQVVIDKVQAESALRWNELIAADLAGDKDTTQRNVHSLASIFRSVGLMSVGDGLGEIEIELRAGNELVPGWLEEFEQLIPLSMTALTERMEEMSRSASALKDDTI
jgi:HPt (histidine-containing phosphotransfer) domain-containing protein